MRKARKEAWEGASSVCPGTKAVYKQRSCTVGNVCPSHSQHVAYHINTLASILSNYTNPTLDQSISSWDKHCSHFKSDRHTHTHMHSTSTQDSSDITIAKGALRIAQNQHCLSTVNPTPLKGQYLTFARCMCALESRQITNVASLKDGGVFTWS